MKFFAVAVFLGLVLACASVSANHPKERPANVPEDVWACMIMQDFTTCKKIPAGERKICSIQATLPKWATKAAPSWMTNPKALEMRGKAAHAAAACKLADPTMARGSPRSPVSDDTAPCEGGAMAEGTYFKELRCCPPPTQAQKECWANVRKAREAAAGGN